MLKNKKTLLSMSLQFFADSSNRSGVEEKQTPLSFESQSEADSWFDKKLSKSLETAKANWMKDQEAEWNAKIEEAKQEATRLAKLSADEKAQEEAKAKKEADEARLADIVRRELRLEALEILEEREMPKELIDAVSLADEETCKKSIDSIETAFRNSVEKAVNQRLASSADKPNNNGNSTHTESIGERFAKEANSRKSTTDSLWNKK